MSVNLSGWHEAALSGQPPEVDAPAVFSAFSCLKRFENGRAALMSE
ncbi:hypothetical protein [uncultured Akkermansia sp.]|nr:hypothetical protein [uncultured Akkermansia sp.]